MRSVHKALLYAMLQPDAKMKKLQEAAKFTELMALSEEIKTAPFGDVWNEYLERQGLENSYFDEIDKYEKEVLSKR